VTPGNILVVEDDAVVASSLARLVRAETSEVWPSPLEANVAATIADARASFRRAVPLAMIVDVGLPDGLGLEFLSWAQGTGWTQPALVITGSLEPELANQASLREAWMAFKPGISPIVRTFLRHLRRLHMSPGERARMAAAELARSAGLTAREAQVLQLVVEGTPRAVLAQRMGVSNNTLKTHVRGVLGKTGEPNLDALHRTLLMSTGLLATGPDALAGGDHERFPSA
jgi:DNA-binding NarL/FixJ family response regulator